MLVGRSASPLYTSMAAKVKIELCRMADHGINDSSGFNIATPISEIRISREEARVVPLLHNNKCHRRMIIFL